jgi:hypothetical protein
MLSGSSKSSINFYTTPAGAARRQKTSIHSHSIPLGAENIKFLFYIHYVPTERFSLIFLSSHSGRCDTTIKIHCTFTDHSVRSGMSVEKYNSFTFHSYRSGTYLIPILHTLRSYGAFHAMESIIFSNT